MMIGKAENTSASYIDPTADAMRASAERAAQTKQDAQKNAAEGLLETNAVYQLDISEEGRVLAEGEKKQSANAQKNQLTDGSLEHVVVVDVAAWSANTMKKGIVMTAANSQEIASLSENMYHIERSIVGVFEMAKRNDGGYSVSAVLQNLGKALNAYSHKQREDIANGRDVYLQGLSDRLNQVDNTNPLIWQIRDLVDMALRGKEIHIESEEFQANAKNAWRAYREFLGLPIDDETKKLEDMPKGNISAHDDMQKFALWQAEREGELIEELTGEGDGKKETHAVGEILQDVSSEEDLRAATEERALLKQLQQDDDEFIIEADEDKEQAPLSTGGYEWNVICKQYLKENPDVAAAFAAYGDPYKTSWN